MIQNPQLSGMVSLLHGVHPISRSIRQFFLIISFKLFMGLLILLSLISCTTVQGAKPVTSHEQTRRLDVRKKDPRRRGVPTPASYYHTLLGLQYEQDRSPVAGAGNIRSALKEYLTALRHDPDAFFLLNRVAFLLNRLGNHEEAARFAERAVRLRPTDVAVLGLLGEIYLASGETQKALKMFDRVVRIMPERSDMYYRMAVIYSIQKDLDRAEEVVRKGIAVGQSASEGYYYLGKISVDRGDLEKGVEYLEKAVSLNPLFERAYLEIAVINEREKRPREAIEIYRQVLEEVNPRSREAMIRLIQLFIEEGSLDEAEHFLHQLAKRDPSNMDVSLQLVRVWVEKKDYARAIEKLLRVVRAVPRDVPLRVYLASLYEQSKAFEKAVSVYEAVLEENPGAYDIRIRLGALYYYKLKNIEAALSQGESAREIDPKREESYLFKGLVLFDAERHEEAVGAFKEGIEMKPKVPDLHFHLGAAYDKLGRFDDLVREMEKTIDLDSNHANALNYLGYTYAEKGIRLSEAIDLVNRAIAVRPDDGYFIDSLGWAYYKKGMIGDALMMLQKAVLLVPDDPVIHEHLGEVYLGENKVDLAREAWVQSLRLNPENMELISRFKEAGFGDPILEDRFQRAHILPKVVPKEASGHGGTSNEKVH